MANIRLSGLELRVLSFFFWFFLWELTSRRLGLGFYLSSPTEITLFLIAGLQNIQLWQHIFATSLHVVTGLLAGVCIGFSLSLLFWYAPVVKILLKPVVAVLGTIPIFVFAPIIILWFGVGVVMKLVLATSAVAISTLNLLYQGMDKVDVRRYKVLYLFGATRFDVLLRAIVPMSLSWLFAGTRQSVSVAILAVFIGEFISSNVGLGYYILKQGALYNTTAVFAGSICLIFLSVVLTKTIERLQKSLLGYFGLRLSRL